MRRVLPERLWDCNGNYIDDHTLTVTMNRLRAKIWDADHACIRTVRGTGYIWTGMNVPPARRNARSHDKT